MERRTSRGWRMATGFCIMAGMMALAPLARAAPQDVKPAVVLDESNPMSAGLSALARTGAEQLKANGIADIAVEVAPPGQAEQILRRFADAGRFPIIAVGRNQAGALDKVAKAFPNIKFTLIDGMVQLDNVRSVLFRRFEAAYLAGYLGARVSNAGKIGFVGGVDDVETRQMLCGYAQGLMTAKPDTELFQNMVGSTSDAGADPGTGAALARGQMDRGADVVMEAARGSGEGVLRAIADAGRLGIGSDVNENALFPNSMLASAIKRVDSAVRATVAASGDGSWQAGVVTLGLKEDGVALIVNPQLKPPISEDLVRALELQRASIADGTLLVHDFGTNQRCDM